MTDRERQMFTRLAGDHDFQRWLREQETTEVKALVMQNEPALIHKTQGKVMFVQKLLASCEATRTRT